MILGLDTATRATSVALWDSAVGLSREARDDPPPGARPGHATRLMPLIEELLEEHGRGWGQVKRIAVGVGPGTFTGLRIGVATARALGHARAIPLVGIPTLQSLAFGARRERSAGAVLAVLDARRRELFAGGWRVEEVARQGAPALLEPAALALDALGQSISALGLPAVAVGEGAVEFRAVLERSGALVPEDSELHTVTALNHCRLADAWSASDPDEVLPEYLRLPDAELSRRTATNS